MHNDNDKEPMFITKEIQAEMIAAGHQFSLPSHIRTKSISDLFGWQPGETLEEAMQRYAKTKEVTSDCAGQPFNFTA